MEKSTSPVTFSRTSKFFPSKIFSNPTFRTLFPALVISLGGTFHFGFQLIVINPTESIFKEFINSSFYDHYRFYLTDTEWNYLWPLVINTQTIGGLIGSFLVGILSEKWGRKGGFYFTNSIILFSCLLQGISKIFNSWETFVTGRFLSGLAQATQMGLQPVFLNEISPKSKRGVIGSMTGIALEIGAVIAAVFALPMILGSDWAWPYLFLIEAAPSCLTLIALPHFHESPKFLASKNDYDAAKISMRFYGRSDQEIKEEIDEIRQELAHDSGKKKSAMSLKKVLSTRHIRKGAFLGWSLSFNCSFSGILALSYFSTSILSSSGVSERDAQFATIGMALPCFVGAFFSGSVMDCFGRRPILLVGYSSMLVLNVLFIVFGNLTRVHGVTWAAYVNIAVAASITFIFGLGPAGVTWVTPSELVPQRARSTVSMWCTILQRVSTAAATMIYYPLNQAIYEFCFLINIIPIIATIVYVALALPETKNKTTLEILRQLGYEKKENKDERMSVEKF